MRENRLSGSEGGGAKSIVSPYPYSNGSCVPLRSLHLDYDGRLCVRSSPRAPLLPLSASVSYSCAWYDSRALAQIVSSFRSNPGIRPGRGCRRARGIHPPDSVCRRPRDHPPATPGSDTRPHDAGRDLRPAHWRRAAKKLVFSWGGNPGVGSLHRLRDAVENDWPVPLEVEEHSHAGMAAAYAAGASGLPFGLLRGYLGSDLPKYNSNVRFIDCPFTGERLAAVPAIRPDVTVVHAQKADRAATSCCGASPACRRKPSSRRHAPRSSPSKRWSIGWSRRTARRTP